MKANMDNAAVVKNGSTGSLGLFECVMILIGGMIGSAIFSLSGLTMLSAGPASILTWLIAGVIMMLYGMLVCELSCRYPQSGGVYVFPRMAFGEKYGKLFACLSCWGSSVTNIIAVAFAAIYVGIYMKLAFPWAGNNMVAIALISIAVVFVLNIIKFKTAGILNNAIVAFLIATIFVYIVSAFSSENYNTSYFLPFFSQGNAGMYGFIYSIPIAIIGYSAITAIAFMVSDVKEPNKTISKSMFIAVSLTILIYILVIAATLGLIDADYLKANESMRFIPLFAACFTKMANIPWLVKVVSISSVIALITTMMVCVSMNARALQAAGQDGMFPSWLGKYNSNGVPAVGAFVTCLPAAIIACFPELTMEIVNLGAIVNVFTITITVVSLIFARRKNLDYKPSFVAPGGIALPVVVLAIFVFCNLSSIITGGLPMLWFTLGVWGIGLIIYFFRKSL